MLKNWKRGVLLQNQDYKPALQGPWDKHKIDTQDIAAAYQRLGIYNKALRIRNCGNLLNFQSCPQGHYKKLKWANFCRARLCPMCSWRRSLKYGYYLQQVTHKAQQQASFQWIFLTLTTRNISSDHLKETLDHLFRSWQRFSQRKAFRNVVQGWFRGLEVTRNTKTKEYHPHFHILLALNDSYFKGQDYLNQQEWAQLWQESLKVEYHPIVDVRTVKAANKSDQQTEKNHQLGGAIAEVAKYPVKPASYFSHESEDDFDDIIAILEHALRHRRLVAFGGVLKTIWKQVEHQQEGLEDTSDCKCPTCQSNLLDHFYRWHFGLKSYTSL